MRHTDLPPPCDGLINHSADAVGQHGHVSRFMDRGGGLQPGNCADITYTHTHTGYGPMGSPFPKRRKEPTAFKWPFWAKTRLQWAQTGTTSMCPLKVTTKMANSLTSSGFLPPFWKRGSHGSVPFKEFEKKIAKNKN